MNVADGGCDDGGVGVGEDGAYDLLNREWKRWVPGVGETWVLA